MTFNLVSFSDERDGVKIRKYPIEEFEEFKDAPDDLRWRATWDKSWEGEVIGIALTAYPVTKKTPKGAWIAPHAWHRWLEDEKRWGWEFYDTRRWVSDDGGAAWAKRTQQEAIDSLIIRFSRWMNRIQGDIDYFLSAAGALENLYPDHKSKAQDAREMVASRVTL